MTAIPKPANKRAVVHSRSITDSAAPKPVGIWIRVSTEDQVRGESPEHHERRARAYADAKGWVVREVYRLDAISGKSVMGYPETDRMLRDVSSGRITGLIFSKLARLARNTRELLDFSDRFRDHGADLISLHESIDTSSPAGRLFYTMIAALAQWEREEIAERIAASVPVRARMGKSLGGAAPYGYRWEGHKLVVEPSEAPVRKLIFDLFLEHRRRRVVARVLNDRGYRTRNGSRWSDTSVHRLLTDPSAKGIRRANYTRSKGDGKPYTLKPPDEWVLIPIEPIVSEEVWEQCNLILKDMKDKRLPRYARRSPHLFTGILHCACGSRMYVMSDSRKYRCPKCHNKVAGDALEAVFLEQLQGILVSPETIAEHLARADEGIRTREERLAALESESIRARADAAKLFRLYTGDHISPAGFEERNRPLEERLRSIAEEIPRLQGEVDFLKIQHVAKDELQSRGQSLRDRWPDLELQEKRQIVEAVVQRMCVGEEEIELTLGYFPSPSEIATASPRKLHGPPLPHGRGRHGRGGHEGLQQHRGRLGSLHGDARGAGWMGALRRVEPLHGLRAAAGHRLQPDSRDRERLSARDRGHHVGEDQDEIPVGLPAAPGARGAGWHRPGLHGELRYDRGYYEPGGASTARPSPQRRLRENPMNATARFALVAPLVLAGAAWDPAPGFAMASPAWGAAAFPAGATETPGEFEIARVQRYLALAERDLRARDTRGLTPDQRTARARHIGRIQAYRERGRFPHNHEFPAKRVPCFVDRHGTRDVLAHLMESTGDHELVLRVSTAGNHATVRELVADSNVGPDFHAWLVSSGFSVEEAQKLQPSYEGERPVVFGEPPEISAGHA